MTGTSPSVVDANIIVRFLVRDDEALYARAAGIMEEIREARMSAVLPDIVIAECVFVLQRIYKVSRSDIAESLRTILRFRGVLTGDVPRLIAALDTFETRNVSIVDSMCLAIASERGWGLQTFDVKLAKLAKGTAGPRR